MENTQIQILDKALAIEAISKAEIDTAISTAKKYPRDVKKAIEQVEMLATLDQETAEECFFALPRAGKTIEGEGIRFAEIVASAWGNIKYATRILGHDGKKVTAQAVCMDLENNISVSKEVDRKITDKYGKTYNEDMIIMTGNAAASIALRNCILQIVPKGLFKNTIEKIKDVAIGKALDFQKTKEKALKYFRALNVKDEEICSVLKVSHVDEIERNHLIALRGFVTAIKEGESDVDGIFRGKTKEEPKITEAIPDNNPSAESKYPYSDKKKEAGKKTDTAGTLEMK